MKKIFMLLVVALLANSSLWAFKREIVTIHSDAMNKDINATVILPDGYKRAKKLPTVYLLHGFSGNY
ncbi:MAG: esterase family protein, partial [Rikenellaceae bacterium]|nr:esterase family protein [Rikenellaceae bacterium]